MAVTGLTPFFNGALTNSALLVKSLPGRVVGWMVYNPDTNNAAFVQVFDTTGNISVGVTAPSYVITLPAGSAANVFHTEGINHLNSIQIAATSTATGPNAPVTGLVCTIFFK